MAKVTVHIPHVAWRDGRPRFQPAANLRALGFKGADLRHADGAWMSLGEATAWMTAKLDEIARVKKARAAGRRARPARAPSITSVAHLLEDYLASNAVAELKPKTKRYYRQGAAWVAEHAPALHVEPVAAVRAPHVFIAYEAAQAKSVHVANCMLATVSAAYGWARLRGLHGVVANPCASMKRRAAPPRLRVGTPAEMIALVEAADRIGLPEIGDMIVLGLWTGQRQGDRLELIEAPLIEGRIVFRQRKTGAMVAIRSTPSLEARLAGARTRKRLLPRAAMTVVVDAVGQAYDEHRYRKAFAAVRASAVAGILDAATGAVLLAPTPSLADFRDQDLRDTAVTWLANAGCTIPEICAITGHSLGSATAVLKHYLAMTTTLADSAVAKLLAWHEGQTAL